MIISATRYQIRLTLPKSGVGSYLDAHLLSYKLLIISDIIFVVMAEQGAKDEIRCGDDRSAVSSSILAGAHKF